MSDQHFVGRPEATRGVYRGAVSKQCLDCPALIPAWRVAGSNVVRCDACSTRHSREMTKKRHEKHMAKRKTVGAATA